jgi:DNA-binding response OmpR family regulator
MADDLRKVVCIEDELEMIELVKLILDRNKFEVTGAVGGQEGLDKIIEIKPDLVLLDLMMPEMDGFQFITELHNTADWQSIPIVVITAMDLTTSDRMRLNGYVQQILQKGAYSRDELLDEVRAQVNAYIL